MTSPITARSRVKRHGIRLAIVLGLCVLAAFALGRYAEPIARHEIIDNLESRLHCTVELDSVSVSVWRGLQVSGSGLRIQSIGNEQRSTPGGVPMLNARTFQFRSTLHGLLFHHSSAITAYAQGLTLTIPAGNDRSPLQQGDPSRHGLPRDSVFLNRLVATDSHLVLENKDPAKQPIVFDFARLLLIDLGGPTDTHPAQPYAYEATLTNPLPLGQINSHGHVGPWVFGNARATPVDGDFTYNHVQLDTIPGLTGTLSAAGRITGTLGAMSVQGTTQTPDFALDISAFAFPVKTRFQALVDGTSGDVKLQQVTANFLHTTVLAHGTVRRANEKDASKGHVTDLEINIADGRAEDLLTLFDRNQQPLLKAAIAIHGHVLVPPGKERLILKLQTTGKADLTSATWMNPAIQQGVDSFSLRATDEGKAAQAVHDPAASPKVLSHLNGDFHFAGGNIDVTNLSYRVPGALLLMNGRYPLVNRELDFHGVARTDASAAHMESGVKRILVAPISPFLHKHGAGMEIPVSFTGDKAQPHFALDLAHHDVDESKTQNRR